MASVGSSSSEPRNEEAVLQEFQRRRSQLNEIYQKIQELGAEVSEHDMVISTLKPMDAGRKCFRMIGEVLVERTVGETMPAVEKHRENLDGVVTSLKSQYKTLEKELQEFQAKYKIRVMQPNEVEDEEEEREASKPSAAQGVLVSSG